MAWVRLDDSFPEHPKIQQVGSPGVALFIRSIAYCNRNLTDGFVPELQAKCDEMWAGGSLDAMVNAGLFERCDGGYRVHDYLDYQPSRAQVLAERASAKERMKRVRSPEVRPKFNDPVPVPVPVVPVPGPEKTKTSVNGVDHEGRDPDEMTAEEAFEKVFWPRYPRKVAKQEARKAWKAMKLKDTDQERLNAIIDGLDIDIAKEWPGRELDKIPHPATWLRGRRWET